VVVDDKLSEADILQVKCRVKECVNRFDIQHATVEVEREHEKCELENC